MIENTTSRGVAKKRLLERVRDKKIIPLNSIPSTSTCTGIEKERYRQQWLTESIPEVIENIGYCIYALGCLSDDDFISHHQYIRKIMLKIYNESFEKASSTVASNIRKSICRIDEALYLNNYSLFFKQNLQTESQRLFS